MKRPNQFSALLIFSVSALTLSALAQNSGAGSGSGSTPGAGSNSRSDRYPSASTNASGSTGSSISRSSDMTGVNSSSQGSLSFDKLDTDKDGRISLTEYIKHAGQGSSASDSSTGSRSGASTGVSGGSQSSQPSQSGLYGQSGRFTATQFQKLDTDHDGYLSRSELNAVQNGSSSDKIKP